MVNILFTGDICFSELTNDQQKKLNTNYLGDLEEHINSADLSLADLQSPLTISEKKIKKVGPSLKALPYCARYLRSFDVISLANNHIMDCGEEGLEETIKSLKKQDLKIVGLNKCKKYSNYDEYIFTKEGKKFAFSSFCEAEFSKPNINGVGACLIDPINIYRKIIDLKSRCDYVFIILHGGYEHFPLPFPEFRKLTHFLIDIGADAIICHHVHVYGPYEIYKNKPIIYSTGNFYYPGDYNQPGWDEGYAPIVKINTKDNKIELEIIPYHYQSNINQIKKLDNKKALIFKNKINKLNKIIKDEKTHNKYIENLIKKRLGATISYLFFWFRFAGLSRLLKFRIIRNFILNFLDLHNKENLIFTFSHRNLILRTLEYLKK